MSENEEWISLTPKEFAAPEVPQYFQAAFQEDYLIKTTALMNIIHQGFQVALQVYFPVENLQSMNLMKLFVIKVRWRTSSTFIITSQEYREIYIHIGRT